MIEETNVRDLRAIRRADIILTDAGWSALADAYGVEVRPVGPCDVPLPFDDDDPVDVATSITPPSPAIERNELTEAQEDGWACVICHADYRVVTTPAVPVGAGRVGQLFACVGCAGEDPSDGPPVADDWDGIAPLAHGEDGQPSDRPVPGAEIVHFSIDDVLSGFEPLSGGEPLPTATVDRPSGRDGGCALWQHPADDAVSPFWSSRPWVRLS